MGSDVALGGDYGGEEQWNYLHDLMYGGASARYGDVERKAAMEKNIQSFVGLPKGSPQRKKALEGALTNLEENPEKFTTSRVIDYLTNRELINPGDLSYTPKAYNEIAWSGLTTPSKQAIGFGINPFEDTRAAGQFYQQQQQQKRRNQILAWQKMKQKQMARNVFPSGYVSAADVARKKITPTYTGPITHDFDPKQDTGRRPDKPGGFTDPGKGSYGPHMAYGGRVSYFDGGLASLWLR